MLDLTKYSNALPSAIEVEGKVYPIKTWFKLWIRFMQICTEGEPDELNFDFLFVDEIPENKGAAFLALKDFAVPDNPLPRPVGKSTGAKPVDYAIDGDMIYAAFMQQYGIDLLDDKDLHWHKFLALFEGLQNTKLNTVMEARLYDETDKTSYEEYKKQSREAWSLAGLDTKKAEEEFNEAFG